MVAVARQPLKWIDHPLLDAHHALTVPFTDRRDDGLPGPDGLDQLRAIEDDLVSAVGVRGRLVAHETADGVRTFHVYTDGEDQNAGDLVMAWAARASIEVTTTPDPSWRLVRHLG